MVTITIRIDELEKEKLVAIAQAEDLSVSQLIRRAIKEYLADK